MVVRLLGTTALGYYSLAFRLADFPTSVVGYTVSKVMFPVYSMLQAAPAALRRAYLQNMQRLAIVVLPVSVGIIVAAEPIVLALLGEKWVAAVTPLRILGVYGLIKSLAAPSGEVFKGVGKPHLGPLFSLPHLVLAIPVLYLLTNAYDLNGAALGILILLAAVGIPATVLAMRLVGVTAGDMARALAAPALCAGILGVALTLLLRPTASLPPVAALLILVVAGIVVYSAAAALFARPVLGSMWTSLRSSSARPAVDEVLP
jgi:PST family polysaccharide transporter/lipopolysaccharide exporter